MHFFARSMKACAITSPRHSYHQKCPMQESLLANLGGGTPRTHLQHMQTANTCQHSALRRTRLRGVGPFALVQLHLGVTTLSSNGRWLRIVCVDVLGAHERSRILRGLIHHRRKLISYPSTCFRAHRGDPAPCFKSCLRVVRSTRSHCLVVLSTECGTGIP